MSVRIRAVVAGATAVLAGTAGTAMSMPMAHAGTLPALPALPVATPDVATVGNAVPTNIPVLTNDTENGQPITDATVLFNTLASQPLGAVLGADLKSLGLPGKGDFTILPDGTVDFVPVPGFDGTVPDVSYVVTDLLGGKGIGTISLTVAKAISTVTDTARVPSGVSDFQVPVLGNDTADSATALAQSTLTLTKNGLPSPDLATLTNDAKQLTVPGQGVYKVEQLVDGTSVIGFTPAAEAKGELAAVKYQVKDKLNSSGVGTLIMTVDQAITAADVSGLGLPGQPLQVDLLKGVVTDPATVVNKALVNFPVVGQPAGAVVSDAGKKIKIPDEGTWSIDGLTGMATFQPVDGFRKTITSVVFQVVDSDGGTALAHLNGVLHQVPVGADDNPIVQVDAPVNLTVLSNDTIDPDSGLSSLTFPALQTDGVTVDGNKATTPEGTFTINPDHTVTFTPNGEVATVKPVVYKLVDLDGRIATAKILPTMVKSVIAGSDAIRVPFNHTVDINVLGNDHGQNGTDVNASTVAFPTTGQPNNAQVAVGGKSMSVPGQGTYSVNADGSVHFVPVQDFKGACDAIRYTVKDGSGAIGGAQLTVAVNAPVAPVDDSGLAIGDVPVTVDVLKNDASDAAAALQKGTVVFPSLPGQPAGSVISDLGKTLTVPNVGTYKVGDDGSVTFTPGHTQAGDLYRGTAAPVIYSVADADGGLGSGKLTISAHSKLLGFGSTVFVPYGQAKDVDVLSLDAADALAPIVKSSVQFPDAGQPAGAVISQDRKQLSITGVGVFTIQSDGTVRFVPATGYHGPVDKVTYAFTGADLQAATATLGVTVGEPVLAVDDNGVTEPSAAVTVDVLHNDTTDKATSLLPGSVTFPVGDLPAGASIVNGVLKVPGQGSYVINQDGTITFFPIDGFHGKAALIKYEVSDGLGNKGKAGVQIVVHAVPKGANDAATGIQGRNVVIQVLKNDTADAITPLDPSTLKFAGSGQPTGSQVSSDGKSVKVPNEGTYTISNGEVTFHPEAGFLGQAGSIAYQVADSTNTAAKASLAVFMQHKALGVADSARTAYLKPITVAVLGNDTTDPSTSFDPASMRFGTAPSGGTLSSDGKTLTMAKQGVYRIVNGQVQFTPASGFAGNATPVPYTVTDGRGETALGLLTMTVGSAPKATADSAVTAAKTPVRLYNLKNDSVDSQTVLNKASVLLPATGQPAKAQRSADGLSMLVPGQGLWRVDRPTGSVVFYPTSTFAGTTSPVAYSVADGNGNLTGSTMRVTVRRPVVARDDASWTVMRRPVTLNLLTNDSADPATPLLRSSARLLTTGQPAGSKVAVDGKSISVPNQGVWKLLSDGRVTFTPTYSFAGLTSFVRYQVADTSGHVSAARMRVRVYDPIIARIDRAKTAWNKSVTVSVLNNDTSYTKKLPSTVGFRPQLQPKGAKISKDGRTMVVPGQGVYRADAKTGRITFTPYKSVSGRSVTPIHYRVMNTSGSANYAVLVVTVGKAPNAIARPDSVSDPYGKAVVVKVLGNDHASPNAKLITGSVRITGAVSKSVRSYLSKDGKTMTIAGQGTYRVGKNGTISFTPAKGFHGRAMSVRYQVTDTNGVTLSSVMAVYTQAAPKSHR